MSEELLANGWDMAAQLYVDQTGLDIAVARDLVIGFFLRAGDMRPFSYWALRGHCPSDRVIRCIALMAHEAVPEDVASALPFALVRKKRGGGKKNSRPNPEIEIYHARLAELALQAGAGNRSQYEAAIQMVVDLLGDQKKHQTVRDAYDTRYSRRLRQRKRV